VNVADVVVRASTDPRRAEAWSFVLEAVGVPHRLQSAAAEWLVVVDLGHLDRAAAALDAHDREAAEEASVEPAPPDHGASPAAVLVPAALIAFFLASGPRGGLDPHGLFRAGSAVAERIVGGEWWRALTALTLHADLAHVLGNAVALVIFLSALCRWLGAGLALALVLAAGFVGNLATAFLYGSAHSSVGASTSAFGALGILGGLQFLRRFRVTTRFDRRRRALAAVAACLGIFAMIGVGERSDVIAHLAGLAAGLGLGLAAGAVVRRPLPRALRWALGALAAAVAGGAWVLALG
jgi:membrane associated rhomboid family serine protease